MSRQWADLLPTFVAIKQAAWQRRMSMLRAVESGATFSEIARHLGLSPTVIRSYVIQQRGRLTRGERAPIEDFLTPAGFTDEEGMEAARMICRLSAEAKTARKEVTRAEAIARRSEAMATLFRDRPE